MRENKKASEVVVGDMVVPPLARKPELVTSLFLPQEGATNAYVTIITRMRKWFIDPGEDVMVDIPDPEPEG